LNKKQKQKNYWFVLDNYVHIALKGDALLFYNPYTGGILEYGAGGAEETAGIIKLVKRLQSAKNQGVVRLTQKELSDPVISQFVNHMRGAFMADMMDTSLSKGKPVQMLPYLKVHKDVEKIKKFPTRSIGEDMMKYLAEVSIYINRSCSLDCDMCASAYRQFLCCTRAPSTAGTGARQGKNEMDISTLARLLEQLKGLPRMRINVLGGDIFKYPELEQLLSLLKQLPPSIKYVFYSHYLNLPGGPEKFASFPPSSSVRIPVTFPVLPEKKEQWQRALETRNHCQSLGIDSRFLFVIAAESDFAEAEELIETHELDDYEFRPFYNGANRAFFEENVFLDKEDILEAKPAMREILARQLVNPFHFGTLTVLSNGHIHANVNLPRLGVLEKDGISDVVYKEMNRGKSWRRIRKKLEPCKHCVFEALCPPLSNYEYALGRNNLCYKD
jgi:pseudo-rSAM protein